MKLIPLPALVDNYIWMLHDGQHALVVDPGDSQPVLKALQSERLRLQGILVTHHHADHTGGVSLLREATGAKVFGPARETMPEPIQRVGEHDQITLLGLQWQVIDVPGHTAGHVAYFSELPDQDPIVFCGDTLFSAGCGRIFDGTAPQLEQSLQKVARLPGATRVCCTHEYTLSNLRFALTVEPNNPQLSAYQLYCESLHAQGLPTLPSTIAQELAINPFLRTDQPTVVASVQGYDAKGAKRDGIFATLRQWKNHFR